MASTQSGWELGRNQLGSRDEEAALDKSAMPRRRAERVRAGKLGPPEFCGDKITGACDSPGGLDEALGTQGSRRPWGSDCSSGD